MKIINWVWEVLPHVLVTAWKEDKKGHCVMPWKRSKSLIKVYRAKWINIRLYQSVLYFCAVLLSHPQQRPVICCQSFAAAVTLPCFSYVMGNDAEIHRIFLLLADRNKDLGCTPKITASQTSSWDGENALYSECAKCCTTTCDSHRAKWPEVTGCKIEVWGCVRWLEVFGVTRMFCTWLSSALLSLAWETAELLHMNSHPSSQTVSMHKCVCASLRQTPGMENGIPIHSNLVEI